MNQAVLKPKRLDVVQETGTVTHVDGRVLTVVTTLGQYEALRAASCLLAPEVGDDVLVVATETGRVYVLAVLERANSSASELSVEGDLAIRATTGRVSVAAQEGIDLLSAKKVQIVGGELGVHASKADVVIETLSYLGHSVMAELSKVKLFGQTLDTVVDRVTQSAKYSLRQVEHADQVRAGSIDMAAKGVVNVRGEHAVVNATELVKVDGGQIHLG